MDLRDTPEEAAWRQEVRAFIDRELPQLFRDEPMESEEAAALWGHPDMLEWRRKLVERGWIAPFLPGKPNGFVQISDSFLLCRTLGFRTDFS